MPQIRTRQPRLAAPKMSLPPVVFEGRFYRVEQQNTRSDAERGLLKSVVAFIRERDARPFADVRTFDDAFRAMLPIGFISGGGANHSWMHDGQHTGHVFDPARFGIWIFHDIETARRHSKC